MVRRDNPCFGCESRSATCRLDCVLWLEYVDKRNKDYERETKLKNAERDYNNYVTERIERVRRLKHGRDEKHRR